MRTVDMSFLSHLAEAQATVEDGVPKGCATRHCSLHAPPEWACSSVVEHCVDIAGVASSILATPTIKNLANSTVCGVFLCLKLVKITVPWGVGGADECL